MLHSNTAEYWKTWRTRQRTFLGMVGAYGPWSCCGTPKFKTINLWSSKERFYHNFYLFFLAHFFLTTWIYILGWWAYYSQLQDGLRAFFQTAAGKFKTKVKRLHRHDNIWFIIVLSNWCVQSRWESLKVKDGEWLETLFSVKTLFPVKF